MASKDAFDGFTFSAFTAKIIPMVEPFMISPSMFFPMKTTRLCIFFHYKIVDI